MAADFENFVLIELFAAEAGGEVGDTRNAEDLHLHVIGGDAFGDGGHADQVCPDGFEEADFGGCFIGRAEKAGVDAFAEGEAEFGTSGRGEGTEAG